MAVSKIETLVREKQLDGKPGFYRFRETETWQHLPMRKKDALQKIRPHSFLMEGDKLFTVCLDHFGSDDDRHHAHQTIWNLQIPLVIEDCGGIRFFYGLDLDPIARMLKPLALQEAQFSYWSLIQGQLWRDHLEVKRANTLDRSMRDNILQAIKALEAAELTQTTESGEKVAISLVLRLLFIWVLIDKGFFNHTRESLPTGIDREWFRALMVDKSGIYNLFKQLKVAFNGNVFEYTKLEEKSVTARHLHILWDLFSGNLPNGQQTLFPVYDFGLVSIGLVASVYDRLIDSKRRESEDAYYTPSFLARYAIAQSLEKDINDGDDCRVFDPSCGTGVFLVETFSRLLERESQLDSNRQKPPSDILKSSIFGLDINADAVNVAIFSLYACMIEHGARRWDDLVFPPMKDSNLRIGNYFDPETDTWLKQIQATNLIGNPPWGSVSKKSITEGEASKTDVEYHLKFIKRKNVGKSLLISDYQIAQSFLIRSSEHLLAGAKVTLIVTSKVLLNLKAIKFREFVLKNFTIRSATDFSMVRHGVGWGAIGPGVILNAIFSPLSVPTKNSFEHRAIKPNAFFDRLEMVVLNALDRKWVTQSLLQEKDWAWKTLLYGSSTDIDLVQDLFQSYRSFKPDQSISNQLDAASDTYPMISLAAFLVQSLIKLGAGFKGSPGKVDTLEIHELPFLKNGGLEMLQVQLAPKEIPNLFSATKDFKTFAEYFPEKKAIENIGIPSAYKAPHLLLKRGLDERPVLAYSDTDCCFTNHLYGFHSEDPQCLKFLGAFLLTKFARYFLFQIDPQWRVERPEIYKDSYLKLPLPIIDKNGIDHFAGLFDYATASSGHNRKVAIDQIEREFSLLLGLSQIDKLLIDYTVEIAIPFGTTKGRKRVDVPISSISKLKEYASEVCEYFGISLKFRQKYISCTIYFSETFFEPFIGIDFKISEIQHREQITVSNEVPRVYDFLTKNAFKKISDGFIDQTDFIGFTNDGFWIVKPNQLRAWHPAIAHRDISRVLGQLMKNAHQLKQ
jgi:hypothetical protein